MFEFLGATFTFFGSGVGISLNKGNEKQTQNNDLIIKTEKRSPTVQRGKCSCSMAVVLEASRLELVLASAAVTLRHEVHDTVALYGPEHKCWTCICLGYKGCAQIVLLKYECLDTGSVVQFSYFSSAHLVI